MIDTPKTLISLISLELVLDILVSRVREKYLKIGRWQNRK
ncbi:hypothetical protein SAMN05421789_10753 [Kaistella chaponensis]|uniref:Uncharacterized protein n=1 Tax=Kaistella chaponensis TaxID=713588 RepID=A0A1N7M2Y0_9FLAO|nr:hypothetical protein SAMN05421789_10753 [Kaistella chaponensis]